MINKVWKGGVRRYEGNNINGNVQETQIHQRNTAIFRDLRISVNYQMFNNEVQIRQMRTLRAKL